MDGSQLGSDRAAPARPRTMRQQNLRLVLREVAERGPCSRAAIAEATGLTRSTVSALVADLAARRLVREATVERSGAVGRPGRMLVLSGERVAGLGLEINVDYLAASVVDLTGTVRHERVEVRENRGRTPGEVLDALAVVAAGVVAAASAEGLVLAATTVAAPGLVDVDTGVLVFAPNLGWDGLALAAETARRMGPVSGRMFVDNDANVAAQGELWQPTGADLGDFVHISGEIGVGAGVVIRGDLVRGGAGFGGEFGHVPVGDGVACPCGSHGCLERYVGQEALLTAAGLDARVGTTVGEPDGGVSALAERALDGDRRTLAVIEDAGRTLGVALATMVNLFAPNTVVLGGSFSVLYDWLRGPLEAELGRRAFVMRYADTAVVPSVLGWAAAVRGAATRSLRVVHDDPLAVPEATG